MELTPILLFLPLTANHVVKLGLDTIRSVPVHAITPLSFDIPLALCRSRWPGPICMSIIMPIDVSVDFRLDRLMPSWR